VGAGRAAFAIQLDEGGTPQFVEPIPDEALVALDVLLSARLREWLILTGTDVELCGHRFKITGWVDGCLMFAHLGPV
jgi:hypothetical protein